MFTDGGMREVMEIHQLCRRKELDLVYRDSIDDIKYVGGCDLAYWTSDGKEYAVCAIVVVGYKTREVVEVVEWVGEVKIPYMSGFLAFRECKHILNAFKLLKTDIDLLMVDGNGTLHNRMMGVASYSSFFIDKPTIGIAKTKCFVDGAEYPEVGNASGDYANIKVGDETIGSILRSVSGVNPIYVSSGNRIDQETAVAITMALVDKGSRLPVTTRFADIEANRARKEITH